MFRCLKTWLPVLLLVALASVAWGQAELEGDEQMRGANEIRSLFRLLAHPDQSMREQAIRGLTDEKVNAMPALVDAVLNSPEKPATLAAVVLIQRVTASKKPTNGDAASEEKVFRTLAEFVARPTRSEDWRWYLATTLLDELQPALVKPLIPALVRAVEQPRSLSSFAAVSALYHQGVAGNESVAAKRALLRMLSRPDRPAFQGLYLQHRRVVLIDNAVAYTRDLGVLELTAAKAEGAKRSYRYFAHDDLLILAAAKAVGAKSREISGPLFELLSYPEEDVRFQACQQLAQLDEAGRRAAADTVRVLLSNPRSRLIRNLADEEGLLLQRMSESSGKGMGEGAGSETPSLELFSQLGEQAGRTAPALIPLLEHPDASLRHAASFLLGEMPKLDPVVRRVATEQLAKAVDLEAYLAERASGRKEVIAKRVDTMEQTLKRLREASKPDA